MNELAAQERVLRLADLITESLIGTFPELESQYKDRLQHFIESGVRNTNPHFLRTYDSFYHATSFINYNVDAKDVFDESKKEYFLKIGEMLDGAYKIYLKAKETFNGLTFTEDHDDKPDLLWDSFVLLMDDLQDVLEREKQKKFLRKDVANEIFGVLGSFVEEDHKKMGRDASNLIQHCFMVRQLTERLVVVGAMLKIPYEKMLRITHGLDS